MKKNKKISLSIILFITVTTLIFTLSNSMLIKPINSTSIKKYGIIDGNLYSNHTNIKKTNNEFINNSIEKKQHGDLILDFMENIAPSYSFYYYNAEQNNSITDDSIIEGLNWMIASNVDCVSISLSSKSYSKKLENWIAINSNKICIYASYNNNLNTFDYPASYTGVIGIGTEKTLNNKNEDKLYKTNHIVLFYPQIKHYYGNSFLTPYTMIKQS